ncbi:MAG: chloride channel protein [Theionarchaea archaeon]|nr:chloride channel protein [Theionarchaea archaeon]
MQSVGSHMPGFSLLKDTTYDEIRMLMWSILIALCVIPVVYSLSFAVKLYFTMIMRTQPAFSFLGIWWVIIPFTVTGIVIGLLIWHVAPETEGPGLHVVIAAFNKRDGELRLRTGIIKYIATLLTLGTGSPNGIVSPSALLGNAMMSYLNKIFPFNSDQKRTLSLCGIAAAITTLLGAPFGAALFAVEVVYGNYILYKRFFYCLSSSITTYVVTYFLDIYPIHFDIIPFHVVITPGIFFLIILTAVIVVLVNVTYIYLYQTIHDFFMKRELKSMNWVKPTIGMILGAVIMAPLYSDFIQLQIVGGRGYALDALTQVGPWNMLLIVVIIIMVTSFIAGSGGSGGLFLPVMMVGILLGITMSSFSAPQYLLFLVVTGMSAALSTTLNVPVASAILGIELFGPLAILPAIIGSLTGYLLARNRVIYHEIQWEELKE